MIDARRKKIYRQSVFGLVGFLFFALAIIFVPNHFCLAEDQSPASWVGNYALGGVGYVVALILGWLAGIVNMVIGYLIGLMINLLVGVAQFSNIIDVNTVKEGWKIVRDICNMFFVLILLAIAIGTILKLENYSLKKMLPKLLIMAILINFSRMIFGVIIDFAQVIMLTFVSAFSNSQGWFIDMFNVQNISSMQIFEKTEGKVNGIGPLVTVTAILAGVFASLATLIIVIVLLLVLIVRIVMLWIYTILSPLVFLGFAFPAVGKHTSRIWEDFIKQVMIGPLLAFFIYLALTTADASSRALGSTFTGSTYCPGNLSAFFCSQDLQKFIITIGLLAGGLMVAQQMGGAAGSIAGKGMGMLRNIGVGGAQRLTGYKAISDRAKMYMSMRRSARDDTIRQEMGAAAGYIGQAKKFVGEKISYLPSKAWGAIGRNKADKIQKEIKELEKEKETLKDKSVLEQLNDNISKGQEFKNKGITYKYNKQKDNWSREEGGTIAYEINSGTILEEIQDTASSEDRTNKKDEISKLIAEKQKKVEALQKRQATADKWARRGLLIGGTTIGTVAGAGLGVVPAIMGALYGVGAVKGVRGLTKKIQRAGTTDLNLVSNYEYEKISKERSLKKEKEPTELRQIMNNPAKDSFDRMASALELISRKESSVAEAKNIEINLVSKFSDKIQGMFRGLVKQNYVGATEFSQNPAWVKEGFERGWLKFHELDMDSLKALAPQGAAVLKTSTFRDQYKLASDASKEAIKASLKASQDFAAREKLAFVEGIQTAFQGFEERIGEFTEKLTFENIQDISKGTNEQIKELMNVLVRDKNLNEKMLSEITARKMKDTTPSAVQVRTALGIKL